MSHILLVEDDTALREGLTELFTREGYAVISACNAAEAKSQLSTHIDLIILDVTLPDGNGVVEDDLAKSIIERILVEKDLLNNIRIKVLPTGGWTNTLVMAYDLVSSRLLLKGTRIIVVLDRDIKDLVPSFLGNHKECRCTEPNYLPISSLEKYIKHNLVDSVDSMLYRKLANYVFQGRPLSAILTKYRNEVDVENDADGKKLFGIIQSELRALRKDRDDLVDLVVKHLMDNQKDLVDSLASFLERRIAE